MEKKVIITGAAGGLGSATAKYFAAQNWMVFATDCDREALARLENVPNVIPMFMDVGSTDSVGAAYQQIGRQTESLDGIVNMAGVMEVGSMVEVEESAVLHLLNINALGMFRVNRIFLPMILKGSGRIINISSETGWESGGPFNGIYSMSKHAVEAYSDSLRRELMLLGIKVVKIQPGPFKTSMVTTTKQLFIDAAQKSNFFKAQLSFITGMMDAEWEKANPPEIMARVTYRAMTTKNPKINYSVRPDPQRAFLEKLPTKWSDGLFKMILVKRS